MLLKGLPWFLTQWRFVFGIVDHTFNNAALGTLVGFLVLGHDDFFLGVLKVNCILSISMPNLYFMPLSSHIHIGFPSQGFPV